MNNILDKLRGGDRRSIGRADEVVGDIEKDLTLFDEVFKGLTDKDPVLSMRVADVVEKVTINKPDLLTSHKQEVISVLETAKQQEVCWHIAQIVPRLNYTKEEKNQVISALKGNLSHKSKIVQVFSMQALADLAKGDEHLQIEVIKIIKNKQKTGSPALKSRARKLLETIDG